MGRFWVLLNERLENLSIEVDLLSLCSISDRDHDMIEMRDVTGFTGELDAVQVIDLHESISSGHPLVIEQDWFDCVQLEGLVRFL